MIDFIVAIPARFASTRLLGKPLLLIGNKPMIQHVAERALLSGAKQVVIATDDQRIADALHIDGVHVLMTSDSHQSGTDRLAECARQLAWHNEQIIVNLQGDEPFAPAAGIKQIAELLHQSQSPMATLCTPIINLEQFENPNSVKVVRSSNGLALYFSRASIPWPRDANSALPHIAQRHIGIYAYRAGFLKTITDMPVSLLERCESLEQLRVLENGYSIAIAETCEHFPNGVDTAEDLLLANDFYLSLQSNSLLQATT